MELNKDILALLEIDDFPITEVTSDQKKKLRERFTSNLNCTGIYYCLGYGLLFTNEEAYKNWLYYAGFEYIKNEFDLIMVRGKFYAFFSNDNDRVAELEEIFI